MAIYLVGDIQGCFSELTALLKQVHFNKKKDVLYLAGDLVARGPNSLETLRFVRSLGKSAKVVLGNHDLHLMAVHAGIKKARKSDLLSELLAAPDIDELIEWLAEQPLIQKIPLLDPLSSSKGLLPQDSLQDKSENYAYMTHAGLSPQWQLSDAIKQAKFVHKRLNSSQRNNWLADMYGEKPNDWLQVKTEKEKFRYSINALTRMRYCYSDGSLEFNEKGCPEKNSSPELKPWFEISPTLDSTLWIFGHWASLMGVTSHKNAFALDTGCVWGKHMTMLRWHDKKLFTQTSTST